MDCDSKEEEESRQTGSKSEPAAKVDTTADIEKAVKFWKHPSLTSVPAEEKIQYLHARGLSEEDIHQVWEKLVDEEDTSSIVPPPQEQQQALQQQQRTLPHTQHYPQHSYPEQILPEESAMDIPALLTLGGALGLTAAAALRWLNGGDFCLLPPPTRGGETLDSNAASTVQPRNVHEDNEEQESFVQVEHNDDDFIEQEEPQPQSEAMQEVLQLLETHSTQQERILQQLSNFTTKQVTDKSMNLLRNHDTNKSSIQQELEEIKTELQKLSATISSEEGNAEFETQLEECLKQLQVCMKQVTSEAVPGTATNTASPQNHTAAVTIGASSAFEPRNSTLPPTENSRSLLLREAIRTLAKENEPSALRAGAQLLYLYVINLSSHPHVPRYRKIFTTNESFKQVKQLEGGKDLLVAVGFEERGNCFEWQGGSDDQDILYLKEAAAALSILKSCHDDTKQLSTNALSVLRPTTPPPAVFPLPALQTPVFIASPPTTKKHPLLDETGDDSMLDISNASEHFESRLESLAQPVMDDMRMSSAPLNMRDSQEDSGEEGEGEPKEKSSSSTYQSDAGEDVTKPDLSSSARDKVTSEK